jgi:signal transduction histidine kinase
MKLATLIFISIFFILLLFSITTFVNYKQYAIVNDNAQFFSLSSNTVRESNQLQRNILNMERNLKNYLVFGQKNLLMSLDSATIENNALLDQLSASLPNNSVQQEKLNNIKNLYNQWFEQYAKPFIFISPGNNTSPRLSSGDIQKILIGEESLNKNIQSAFRELLNIEYATRTERKATLDESEQRTKNISFLLTGLSVVVGFIIAILLAQHISRRISKMVSLSNQIARGDYHVQVNDKNNDELTELTKSLNYMAKTLEETITQLQRKNQELNQFAHIVSHDLKAPLRGIDNVVSWIEEDHSKEISPKVSEYLQLIKGRILRSENLIEGILSYARIGKDVQDVREIEVYELVNEIVASMPVKDGLTIIVSNELPVIHSEEIPLTQVFTNLISNAIKYHDKPKGNIKIYSKQLNGRFEFFVEDDGPGIDKKYHDKIFMIFQTLQERDSFESTGVGLAIVRKILDERKQKINIVSEPGKGTIFSFTWSQS